MLYKILNELIECFNISGYEKEIDNYVLNKQYKYHNVNIDKNDNIIRNSKNEIINKTIISHKACVDGEILGTKKTLLIIKQISKHNMKNKHQRHKKNHTCLVK